MILLCRRAASRLWNRQASRTTVFGIMGGLHLKSELCFSHKAAIILQIRRFLGLYLLHFHHFVCTTNICLSCTFDTVGCPTDFLASTQEFHIKQIDFFFAAAAAVCAASKDKPGAVADFSQFSLVSTAPETNFE